MGPGSASAAVAASPRSPPEHRADERRFLRLAEREPEERAEPEPARDLHRVADDVADRIAFRVHAVEIGRVVVAEVADVEAADFRKNLAMSAICTAASALTTIRVIRYPVSVSMPCGGLGEY